MNTATIPVTDFLDILFDGRNKEYGAYALRRKYDQRVRNAMLGTASIVLVVIAGYVINNRLLVSGTHIRSLPPAIAPIRPIDPLIEEAKPLPPPPALPSSSPPPVKPSIKFVNPAVVADEAVAPEDAPPPMDELTIKAVGVTTADGVEDGIDPSLLPEGPGTGVIEAPVPAPRDDREKVFTGVEIPPSFPGGLEALARYLGDHIRYPHLAAENNISGVVTVQFVVDYEGKIKDVKVLSLPRGGGLEEEATRVIKAMPRWKPGRQNGRAVSVLYSIPVNFRLN
ncbi:energy transducer TonB [Chitinophaga japonensis]|uniref:Protein TonB n=1 Tax=Chitinophaga japonensis TaxID=104662 RepID=A0A562T4H8_CHIJA|nr:energy transducer TonB [Chitinophaga japonensis]TWI87966.1 protein TonB [Chitinophaga japonensis]